jgi:hypothetical protein
MLATMDTNDTNRTPPVSTLRRFRTPIRGHAFAPPPPQAGGVSSGTPARLVREPANPADPLAVAVWVTLEAWGPWRLGYLDRGVAARIAPRLDAGLELGAELDGWTPEPDGRWQRPLIALWPVASVPVEPGPEPVEPGPGPASTAPRTARSGPGTVAARNGHGSIVRDARLERRLPGVRRRRVG